MSTVQPSQKPPAGLQPADVPQFVTVGFDDNGYSGCADKEIPCGVAWASAMFANRKNPAGAGQVQTYDGRTCHASFYFLAEYIAATPRIDPPDMVKRAWHDAFLAGHEAGNHSFDHPHGVQFSSEQWKEQIVRCTEWLIKPAPDNVSPSGGADPERGAGIPRSALQGFRAPYIEYNDALFIALEQMDMRYDCSIEEGWQQDHNGTNFFWPYTLEHGSPGNETSTSLGLTTPVLSHPRIWEFPVYTVIVPPDLQCDQYGAATGLRERIHRINEIFNPETGKITGLDWNLLVECRMNKEEFLATLKYSLDLRLEGNRCPFLFGAHSDLYCPGYTFPPNISWKQRQQVLEEFLDYALSKQDVRVVSTSEILDWIERPFALQR